MARRKRHYMQLLYTTNKAVELADPSEVFVQFSFDDLAQIVEDLEKIREDPPQEITDPKYEQWNDSFYIDDVFFRVNMERMRKEDGSLNYKAGFKYEVQIKSDFSDHLTHPVTAPRTYTSEELKQKPVKKKR